MNLLTSSRLLTFVLTFCLLSCQVRGHTSIHSQPTPDKRKTSDLSHDLHLHQVKVAEGLEGEEGERRTGECEDGWVSTHHHCLLDTGLGEGEEAKVLCSTQGAEEARGICVKKSLSSSLASLHTSTDKDEAEQGTSLPSPSGTEQSGYVCPSGWTQYEEYCFFRPGTIPKICGLLGARYVFNFCYTRVPHTLPADFMDAVKRLGGSDDDMHRDTRMCCCGSWGGFCRRK